jgi:hypothetical protein
LAKVGLRHGDTPRPTNGQDWAEWLEAATKRVNQCNACLAKEKRCTQGTRVRSCAKKIQLAKLQLQKNPTNVEVKEILSDAQGKLAKIFQTTVARNWHLTSTNWLRYGDTCSKTFFDFHRIGKKKP